VTDVYERRRRSLLILPLKSNRNKSNVSINSHMKQKETRDECYSISENKFLYKALRMHLVKKKKIDY